jgi:hypothetical protein
MKLVGLKTIGQGDDAGLTNGIPAQHGIALETVPIVVGTAVSAARKLEMSGAKNHVHLQGLRQIKGDMPVSGPAHSHVRFVQQNDVGPFQRLIGT